MSGLPRLDAWQWAALVRTGQLDPVAGVAELAARATALDGGFRALLGTDLAGASRRAAEIRDRAARGEDPGPLAGVPFAVKNNIAVAGWPLTCGSRMLESFRSSFSATVIERLSAAGAIPLAWSNLDEFAMGASTENSAFGPVRNPHDPSRVPGGSSGGSAAAVAAGYVPFALGSETGGSVRQPAAFCGLFGLKPTYGRLSRYGLVAFASSLDHIGLFARSARDLALLFEVAAGHDARDSTSLPDPPAPCRPALAAGVNGLRVGLLRSALAAGVDGAIRDAVSAAAAALQAAGAAIVECDFPYEEAVVPTYYIINTAEASSNLARFDGARYGLRHSAARDLSSMYSASRSAGFGAEVKRRILLGTFALSAGYHDEFYLAACQARTLICDSYRRLFERCDLLLGATTPTPAFRLGEKSADPVQMYLCDVYTCSANLAGVPALNVPAGRGGDGLPRGVQLTAPARGEAELLRAAALLERELGGAVAAAGLDAAPAGGAA